MCWGKSADFACIPQLKTDMQVAPAVVQKRYLNFWLCIRLQNGLFLRREIKNLSAFIESETGKKKWMRSREQKVMGEEGDRSRDHFGFPVSYSTNGLGFWIYVEEETLLHSNASKIYETYIPVFKESFKKESRNQDYSDGNHYGFHHNINQFTLTSVFHYPDWHIPLCGLHNWVFVYETWDDMMIESGTSLICGCCWVSWTLWSWGYDWIHCCCDVF